MDQPTPTEKAQNEINDYMIHARQYTCTVEGAKQDEMKAQDIARMHKLPIPELSDVEMRSMAQEEIGDCMIHARQYSSTVDQAKQWELHSQDLARRYNLPIPELSDVEIRTKAHKEINNCMIHARQYASTVDGAKQYEKQAQNIARIYNLPIPELSDFEIRSKAQQEIDEYMTHARQYAGTMDRAREYEKAAQTVARTNNLPISKLSDTDIKIIRQREIEDRV
jgi:hypothetical protein